MKEERLQKILAQAGLCSRREAEKWIQAGHVFLNGKKVTELGTKANPYKDRINVNGRPLDFFEKKVYYLFYKPRNVMVTKNDPEGRPTIYEYLKNSKRLLKKYGFVNFKNAAVTIFVVIFSINFSWLSFLSTILSKTT